MAQKADFLSKAIALQDGVIAWATGKSFEESVYEKLRREFMGNADLKPKLPKFVQLNRDFPQILALYCAAIRNL